MTGMEIDEAAEFIEMYLSKYPKLRSWLKEQGEKAVYYGYTESIGGRKRFYYIPEIDHPEYNRWISQIKRWGANQPIQASCADVLKLAMSLIYKEIRKRKLHGKFKLTVHDEIVMQWPDIEVEIGEEIMKSCMQKAYDTYITGIINPIDVAKGKAWEKL